MYNYNSKFWIYTVYVENMKHPDVNLVYGSSEDVIQYMLDDMHDDASTDENAIIAKSAADLNVTYEQISGIAVIFGRSAVYSMVNMDLLCSDLNDEYYSKNNVVPVVPIMDLRMAQELTSSILKCKLSGEDNFDPKTTFFQAAVNFHKECGELVREEE